jgi:hypothetical protein
MAKSATRANGQVPGRYIFISLNKKALAGFLSKTSTDEKRDG